MENHIASNCRTGCTCCGGAPSAPVACTGRAAADAAQQHPRSCRVGQAGVLPTAPTMLVFRLICRGWAVASTSARGSHGRHAAVAGTAPHTRLRRRIHLPIHDTGVGSARQPEHTTRLGVPAGHAKWSSLQTVRSATVSHWPHTWAWMFSTSLRHAGPAPGTPSTRTCKCTKQDGILSAPTKAAANTAALSTAYLQSGLAPARQQPWAQVDGHLLRLDGVVVG